MSRCEIMVKGEYILELYKWYKESKITINRKYQRKLVWSLKEKQAFIDTIIKNYPVPLFLVANTTENINGNVQDCKEIIDGLQRIEAIISFINNEFKVDINGIYQYFDRSVYPGNEILLRKNEIHQKRPIINSEICEKFLIYELPITTINANETVVENVFKRINSTGRKLSSQDLRHAGVISNFSTLVSNSAMAIRGDNSENVITLQEMSKHSLNSSGLHYGIDINDVFWIKQGIINEDGIRRSKDEEIIANLYNCIISNYSSGMSAETLNRLYNENTDIYKKNEEYLTPSNLKYLGYLLGTTIGDLEKVFDSNNTTFENLLFKNKSCPNKDLVFIIIVLSIIQLKAEYYIIEDHIQFSNVLNNIADKDLSEIIKESNCIWNREVRNDLIDRVKNRLKKYMVYKKTDTEFDRELIDLLLKAKAEKQMYDFKIGMTDLRTGDFNKGVIEKCIKTLTAMANTRPNEEGVIILGVSDKETDAKYFDKFYNTKIPKYNDYYIAGIENEASKIYGGIPNYIEAIKNLIKNSTNISKDVIFKILTTVDHLQYNDKTLFVMKLKTDKPLFYNKELYVRYQSEDKLIEMGSPEFYEVLDNFKTTATS